jgi:hypothetical protein
MAKLEMETMNMRNASLLVLAALAVGSCASADTIYEQRSVVQPYYGSATVNPYVVSPAPVYVPNSYSYSYYNNPPSVAGFVDRSAKTGIGVPAKAAKEVFKAVF